MTPYEAVNRENMHEVLMYANVRAIQAQEREALQKRERMKSDAKKKKK